MESNEIVKNVQDYYGKQLKSSNDLKTSVCTNMQIKSAYQLKLYENIPKEIKEKYYGCGLISPDKLNGTKVIDLGCGSGLDCYFLAQIVGKGGSVTGVDMTIQQIEIAEKYLEDFKLKMNDISEMKFVCGYLENLRNCDLNANEFDVAISNCVINLTVDKEKVFRSAYEILKDGGELYFSDVYSDRDIPNEAKENKILWGECISGALVWEDLFKICKSIGYSTPRLVTATEIYLNEDIRESVPNVRFISATYRLFKVATDVNEPVNVQYLGEEPLVFDMFNSFEPNKITTVDGELFSIICLSRYKDLFQKHSSIDHWNECISMNFNPFLYANKYPSNCGSSKCC